MNTPRPATAQEAEAYRRVLDHTQDCHRCNHFISCETGDELRQALKAARRALSS